MRIAKKIISVVWPIIYSKLVEAAQSTKTEIDDHIVQAVNTFIIEWLDSEKDE